MQTFSDWIQFSVSSAVVLLFLVIVALLLVILMKRKNIPAEDSITIEHLNKKWDNDAVQARAVLLNPKEYKAFLKERSKADAQKKDEEKSSRKRVFVIDFEGDVRASQCQKMREQITTIISIARPSDEVVVRLESPGGAAHSYGLAASQLARLRSRNIKTTAAVDKVAASGGYMIACVADRLVAAPFAFIGSIGVITGTPNLSRFLKKHDIDYVEQTAGQNKRNVSLFGELTDEKREKLQDQLNLIHDLFKKHVLQFRPQVDIAKVSTGDVWPASEALKLQLVDELKTSDDLLLELGQDADIYLLKTAEIEDFKAKLLKKFFASARAEFGALLRGE